MTCPECKRCNRFGDRCDDGGHGLNHGFPCLYPHANDDPWDTKARAIETECRLINLKGSVLRYDDPFGPAFDADELDAPIFPASTQEPR